MSKIPPQAFSGAAKSIFIGSFLFAKFYPAFYTKIAACAPVAVIRRAWARYDLSLIIKGLYAEVNNQCVSGRSTDLCLLLPEEC